MKQRFLILFALVLLIVPVCSYGQKPTRVKFAKGATKAVAVGTLNSYRSKPIVFVIRVKAGQTLRVEQLILSESAHCTTFSITNPSGKDAIDGEANCNNRKKIENTSAGDYRIAVTECTKADGWRGNFRIKFTVM
jgi:hypothetical protein